MGNSPAKTSPEDQATIDSLAAQLQASTAEVNQLRAERDGLLRRAETAETTVLELTARAKHADEADKMVADLQTQVDEFTEIVAENEQRWTSDPLRVEAERDEARQEINKLQHTLATFSDAIIRGHELPCTDAEIKAAASTPPGNLPGGVMPIATYNAILGRSTSELPNSIVVGIDASRARIKENEVMRRAMQQAQDKVTEYWKRLERHETEAMEQQKAMLVLQNQNEVLQKNQNPRLRGKELFKQKAKLISTVGRLKLGGVAGAPDINLTNSMAAAGGV